MSSMDVTAGPPVEACGDWAFHDSADDWPTSQTDLSSLAS